MSLEQLATPDSAELLVMFETAAAQAQAAWEEQENGRGSRSPQP